MNSNTRPLRQLSTLDRWLAEADRAMRTVLAPAEAPDRTSPGDAHPRVELSEQDRRHVAGLMRINHAGEVCAQALYYGQAAVARDPEVAAHLTQAAREEGDHLAWCEARLHELGSHPSVVNPFWYAGAFAIGASAGLIGDRLSLGFVVETERQVESHLGEHLTRLPPEDERTRAVLEQMQADEIEHGADARRRGGIDLPWPLPRLMQIAADTLRAVAYRV
ncbi:MAG: 2-polyprenyl-3-methyl-6-methoxy-1,4-benzoquinone monooxygenase [Xanthomonadales bacterium]|nr:2-polyprenyl-3-methyl-6-methoxy-1,4-benzoquinone monooxygenase [Xanthomonadales bacterium]MCB1611301.1 2-polyprenyl-3-methyl-6-methoxy-1,4-benzoquinone monooxygenase [Xanthomonadales bacterium]MCP5475991.1 2-polyprenyl-3-methyl-6-methoxy-1,4-benzoquinone monooxygenase [Rhodanobacteraceae bacterium]